MKVFVSESTSVRCFVHLHHRDEDEVAHIDMCCRTLKALELLGFVIVALCQGGNREIALHRQSHILI